MLEKSSQIATILALLITIVSIFLGLNFTNFTNFHTFSEDKNLKNIFVLLGDNSNKLNGDLSFNLYNISAVEDGKTALSRHKKHLTLEIHPESFLVYI